MCVSKQFFYDNDRWTGTTSRVHSSSWVWCSYCSANLRGCTERKRDGGSARDTTGNYLYISLWFMICIWCHVHRVFLLISAFVVVLLLTVMGVFRNYQNWREQEDLLLAGWAESNKKSLYMYSKLLQKRIKVQLYVLVQSLACLIAGSNKQLFNSTAL